MSFGIYTAGICTVCMPAADKERIGIRIRIKRKRMLSGVFMRPENILFVLCNHVQTIRHI